MLQCGMLIGVAGLAAGAAFLMWAVRGRASSAFGPSVYKGCSSRPAIALTFDDGPSESTPQVLDLLAHYRAKATFFQCGWNVERLPTIAREVARQGHEIGNHGYSHTPLYLRSPRFIRTELTRAQDAIVAATGTTPLLFRPPFGVRWFGLRKVQRQLGLMGVMWTAIGLDWKLPGGAVVERLLRHAAQGAILCLHDGRLTQPQPDIRETVEALRRLLPELRARGFHFETVSQILCPTS